ncbi:MAG: hypothetical protein IT537_25150 [Hyphomicrobiales bacterium]|nr:hypothetical protein [Hyphomicrobiales bacterium]
MATNRDRTIDGALILKDSGAAVTADALATVGGSTATLDLGDGYFQGDLVVDMEATVDTTTGDEYYRLQLIGCASSGFASSVVVLGTLELGDATQLAGAVGGVDTDKGTTGQRYILPFDNQINTTTYRYLRLVANVSGTTPSIDYTAFVAKRQ